jgi:phosphomannomutase
MSTNPHIDAYAQFLASKADIKRPLVVVCDASNGPAGMIVRELERKLVEKGFSIKFHLLNDTVDPDFSAHGPDPSNPRAITDIAKKIIETKADLGVIFDGDGDRAVFVDERGLPIPPAVAALYLIEHTPGIHVADTLIYEAIIHTDPALQSRIVRSKVGRYFINKTMREKGGVIGAEFSGHFFFRDFFDADSAIFTMIMMLNMLSLSSAPVSEAFTRYSGHVVMASKANLSRPFKETLANVQEYLSTKAPVRVSDEDGLTIDFGESWINMRASNTEPVARITAGTKDPIIAQALVGDFMKLLG